VRLDTCAARCERRAGRGFTWDALDLYSARSRQALVRAAASIFGVAEPVVNEDLGRVVEYAETWEPLETPAVVTVEVPPAEKAEALAVLRAPDLLDRIRLDLGGLPGGDSDNRLLGYLAALSRKLAEPLSVLVLFAGSAGKSHLADAITRLVPAERSAQVHAGHGPGALLFGRGRAQAQAGGHRGSGGRGGGGVFDSKPCSRRAS